MRNHFSSTTCRAAHPRVGVGTGHGGWVGACAGQAGDGWEAYNKTKYVFIIGCMVKMPSNMWGISDVFKLLVNQKW